MAESPNLRRNTKQLWLIGSALHFARDSDGIEVETRKFHPSVATRVPMLESVDLLDAYVRDSLEDNRFYSKQSWVPPAKTADAEKIHDVVIVGAGQSGLALAFQLKLRGVRRIAVVDSQEKDRAGPWWSFARMPRMRNPKMIPGPDCGNPLLRFKSWFCAAYSEVEYNSFDFVPLKYWQEYLSWFRAVLEIETINNTTVTNIEWDEAQRCLLLETNGPGNAPLRVAARKVCLATGMTAAGSWEPPEAPVDGLPGDHGSEHGSRFRGRNWQARTLR